VSASNVIITPTNNTKRFGRKRLWHLIALLLLCLEVLVAAHHHKTGNEYITFGTLWASGNAANHGLNPYAAYPESFLCDYTIYGYPIQFRDLNLNPPWALPFMQALSRLPLNRFAQVWALLTGICLLMGCIILILWQPGLQKRQLLWFVLCPPTLETIFSGQIYAWPFLLGVLASAFHKKGNLFATGIAIGIIVAARPTMGFWVLLLFLCGYRKIAAVSSGTILTAYALPLVIYGPGIYVEWGQAFGGDKHWMSPMNIAIIPLFIRHGHKSWGVAIAILISLCACCWTAWKRPDFISTSGIALCLGIICAPLAWMHYLLFVAPFFMAREWTLLPTIAAGLFFLEWAPISDASFGIVCLIGTAMILAYFVVSSVNRPRANHHTPRGDPGCLINGAGSY